MKRTIELRSDTYTKPTPAMRQAMYKAEVGNDGMDEDPTVNRLQEMAADQLGKEAALFVASGTMGNLCALLAHCQKGDIAIMDSRSHIFCDEGAGFAAFGGILAHPLESRAGCYDADELAEAIMPGSLTQAQTKLVCLENTHNRRGGIPIPASKIARTADIAHSKNLAVHMDGARIFNAAVALGQNVKELTRYVDSLQFCLSKGLACPIGSLVLGSKDFVGRAKRVRRCLGGGMRQAGIVAAAGLVALETMVERLATDHEHAATLALGLSEIPGLTVDSPAIRTNMVFLNIQEKARTDKIVWALRENGINVTSLKHGLMRLVVHCEITDEDVQETIRAFGAIMSEEQ